MSILVTGGAGYIGSHTIQRLLEQGESAIVVDNFSTGHKQTLNNIEFVECDIRDKKSLSEVFKKYSIDAVIHFAASSLVGESMVDPAKYYENNLVGTLRLLEVMAQFNVKNLVFSSTAATYGNPIDVPISEDQVTRPTNTYGETKLAMEHMMKWFETAHGIKYVALRYFNAAGAHPNGMIGEDHSPETHLIPLVFQVALNQRKYISVYGDDYPTKDGTCIRDYIHVCDLADAHVKAVQYLRSGQPSTTCNLGNGDGYSVLEIIQAVREVTNREIPTKIESRRNGDPAILIADATKAKNILGWLPQYTDIKEIIKTAWKWHQAHPNGYQ